jgi:NTP pyrophosphatase (non-canonical NTP hydrolase)
MGKEVGEMIGITAESFHLNTELTRYFNNWVNRHTYLGLTYVLYARTAKLTEECGEVMEAVIAYADDNPRKLGGPIKDVEKELCDVILTAMCALASIEPDEETQSRLINDHFRERYYRLLPLMKRSKT